MKNSLLIVFGFIFITACKSTKETVLSKDGTLLDEIEVVGTKHPYRPSAERTNDLIHTALNVGFDWNKQYLFGEATLTLSPYFYPTDEVVLDAKGMDIETVSLPGGDTLEYHYDGELLSIQLDRLYHRTDEYSLFIKYISKPNELKKTEGLSAISDDKGLYFINPLGEDPEKPMQIWTQGEPESNSVWFPTIDKPNERCTQEITMTVENRFMAMSNGVLVEDIDNGDGTHSVSWRQDIPHAPYLFMMAIGEFAQIKDEWNGMSVDYFVEEKYKDVAQEIFGETPAMLTFFSEQLGVKYAWDKYWQVCVRDYVSGAMENTTAVIFGEFVQRDERELLDEDYEDIVAHELYHHWFGDLVTCESWANLPLNESFATYGEVLWREHRYGEDEKYRKIYDDMDSYFSEAANGKQVDMIRYHHDTAEDMFDSHSYAKGGVILNMLRDIVGDEAFFASLRLYLEDNKFESVEIHNLRLAFEEVTGQDLNWFFNQWFLSAGHPLLDIQYEYTDSSVIVNLWQEASVEDNLIYRLPMEVDIHTNKMIKSFDITFEQREHNFEFIVDEDEEILWVNVDAKKSLLADILNYQSEAMWIQQYKLGLNMLDKLYALEELTSIEDPSEEVLEVLRMALDDDYWFIQDYAAAMYPLYPEDEEGIRLLKSLAMNAENTEVRSSAILTLSLLEDPSFDPIYEKGLNDPSYRVNAASLEALLYTNPDASLKQAEAWENVKNYEVLDVVGYVYSEVGGPDKVAYFKRVASDDPDEYSRLYALYYYSMFLTNLGDAQLALDGIDFIENWGNTDDGPYSVNVALSSLNRIQRNFDEGASIIQEEIDSNKNLSKAEVLALENEKMDLEHVSERASEAADRINQE